MRLIDGKRLADEILGELFKRGQESGIWEEQLEIGVLTYRDIEFANGYDKALDEVYRKINDMPTVKAIPIEWIIKWLTKQTIPALHTCDDYDAVNMMLDDWEKENER